MQRNKSGCFCEHSEKLTRYYIYHILLSCRCPSACLSVCHQKTQFSQKLSNLELQCLFTTYRKSHTGFSKNLLLDPYNPRWQRSAILKIDMSFFSAEGGPIWIIFWRLVQNDVDCSDVVEIETRCRIPIWRTFGQIQWHVIPASPATLQGAASWKI